MHRHVPPLVAAMVLLLPSAAYASSGSLPAALSAGAGILALVSAVFLLAGMLSLARLAEGAAIADNIHFGILGVICLAASVLIGWIGRWAPDAFSSEHARLGADLLSVASMALFGVYFVRVRLAMSRFLKRLTGEEQMLVAVVDPDAPVED
ncbi:MAG: hypothetical protein EG823_05605 [Actinobacteria bacterium]|nr:hypothetical protein [Actinomycetota bacterium]